MGKELDRLVEIVARLRAPGGCPWDREQTHKSLLNCLLDETYEVCDAIESEDPEHLREELGDLLLQVVLHARMEQDEGRCTIEDVARGISEKLIRRHPHVFGSVEVGSSSEVIRNWEVIKKNEKGKEHRTYVVDDVPESMPALFRAEKIQRRVARVGFDWKEVTPVLDKVEEEFREFREAIASGDQSHASEELGDILFALVNVARHKGFCAEESLRMTTNKFAKRFRFIEDRFREMGKKLESSTLEEMDTVWEESKKAVG